MDPGEYQDIVTFLQSSTLKRIWPQDVLDKNTKSNFRKKVKPFILQEGTLFYSHKTHGLIRVVKPDEVETILKSCHQNPMGGHQGVRRTWQKISSRYHWPSMQKDVKRFVDECDPCQRQNRLAKTPSELHPIPVKDKAFSMLGMDLVGPLRRTAKGNMYIAVLTDYLTKWPEVKAIPSKEASEISSFIIETVCRHGCPEVILTDRGTEFCNQLNDQLCRQLSIERRVTTAYHPQTNGLTERFNQTLCNAIVKYVNTTQDDWDLYLQQIAFATRTCVQASTKETPFQLTYGRKAVLPVQLDIPTTLCSETAFNEEDYQELINDRAASFAELMSLQNIAKERIKDAQAKQKQQYDKRNRGKEVYVGQHVLIRNKKRVNRKGDKLQAKWVGPYQVTESVGKGVFKVEGRKTKINIKDMKGYLQGEKYKSPVKVSKETEERETQKSTTKRKRPVKVSKETEERETQKSTTKCNTSSRTTASLKTSKKTRSKTRSKTKDQKQLPPQRKMTTRREQKKMTAKTAQKKQEKPARKGIQEFVEEIGHSTLLDIFNTCCQMPLEKPANPTDTAIQTSPRLSLVMEANDRHEEETETCHQALLKWYITSKMDIQLLDTLEPLMLASALITTAFKDSINIKDILKTVRNVPTSSLNAESPCKVLKNTTKMTIGSTTLDRKDLCTLFPDKWLNDQVIHAYLGLLKDEHNAVHQRGCYVLPCFLATKWEAGDYTTWLYPKVPLQTYKTILLPVCHQHHWFLMVAFMDTATICVLDSLPNAGRSQKFCTHWRHFMAARGDDRTWTTGDNSSNKQMDGNSCGIFVLMNAEAITQFVSPKIMRHCHVRFFRKFALKKLLQDPSKANDASCDLPFCNNNSKHLRRNQCSRCDRWAHPKCLGLHPDMARSPCVFC